MGCGISKTSVQPDGQTQHKSTRSIIPASQNKGKSGKGGKGMKNGKNGKNGKQGKSVRNLRLKQQQSRARLSLESGVGEGNRLELTSRFISVRSGDAEWSKMAKSLKDSNSFSLTKPKPTGTVRSKSLPEEVSKRPPAPQSSSEDDEDNDSEAESDDEKFVVSRLKSLGLYSSIRQKNGEGNALSNPLFHKLKRKNGESSTKAHHRQNSNMSQITWL